MQNSKCIQVLVIPCAVRNYVIHFFRSSALVLRIYNAECDS